jgi:hypothetical protein
MNPAKRAIGTPKAMRSTRIALDDSIVPVLRVIRG